MAEQESKAATDSDKERAEEIAATPGHAKAQQGSQKPEPGGQAMREVADGKKDEATDRTGRYR